MKKKIFLSVVIPAFNEVENFKRGCLVWVAEYLKKQKYLWEVILVDDGSTDATPRLLKDFVKKNKGFKYIRVPHGGKFTAVKTGITETKGKYVVFSDFDQSVPLFEFEKMLPEFKKGADLVIASRYQLNSKISGGSLFNHVKSKLWNNLTKLIMGREFKDTSCGFKAFKNSVARQLIDKLQVHKVKQISEKIPFMGCFDLEMLFIAKKRGLRIAFIPVDYHFVKSERFTFRETLIILGVLFKIWLSDLLGRYDQNK